jgi:methylated-DNA-[protein]-cysteine S-methyltransferase
MSMDNPSKTQKQHLQIFIAAARSTYLGSVWVGVSQKGLLAVEIQADPETFTQKLRKRFHGVVSRESHHTGQATQQIREYLRGVRSVFDLPIDWTGLSDFQKLVLQTVMDVPYGQMRTYGEIAELIGKPGAARAVGRANATNPMPLVIPCHRLIGSDGSLRGYGAPGGMTTKAWLLDLESRYQQLSN